MTSIDIISSDSLFTNDELDMLDQLNTFKDETLINEYKNGLFTHEYYSNDHFNPNINSLNETPENNKNADYKVCPKCKGRLQDLGVATSECSKCGAEISNNSEDHEIKKASGFTGSTQMNYINCDSKAYIRTKIIKELKQKNYDGETLHKIPAEIIEAAVDKFLTISEKKIHRGGIQRGLKGMLIKYMLDERGINKSTKIIGQIYKLTDKQLSAADALIRYYVAEGVISINCLNVDNTQSFIVNYVKLFGIELKYVKFIYDIILEANRHGIHLINNFKPSTKATGAFLLFIDSFPNLKISKEVVIKQSGLTSSTVYKYYNLMQDKIHLVNDVYVAWKITPPVKAIKQKIQKGSMLPTPVILKFEPLAVDKDGVLIA